MKGSALLIAGMVTALTEASHFDAKEADRALIEEPSQILTKAFHGPTGGEENLKGDPTKDSENSPSLFNVNRDLSTMGALKLEFTQEPQAADVDFLTQRLNQETPEFGVAHTFAFYFKNARDEIIAGCNGSVFYGSIYTDQLWVHPDYRKFGLGRRLMEKVHGYGRQLGCTMATVATMSFQGALGFYEHMGYTIDFARKGHVHDSTCFILRQPL